MDSILSLLFHGISGASDLAADSLPKKAGLRPPPFALCLNPTFRRSSPHPGDHLSSSSSPIPSEFSAVIYSKLSLLSYTRSVRMATFCTRVRLTDSGSCSVAKPLQQPFFPADLLFAPPYSACSPFCAGRYGILWPVSR